MLVAAAACLVLGVATIAGSHRLHLCDYYVGRRGQGRGEAPARLRHGLGPISSSFRAITSRSPASATSRRPTAAIGSSRRRGTHSFEPDGSFYRDDGEPRFV
jgi:hypothetical protein